MLSYEINFSFRVAEVVVECDAGTETHHCHRRHFQCFEFREKNNFVAFRCVSSLELIIIPGINEKSDACALCATSVCSESVREFLFVMYML